jgi:CRISPR-associated protein Cmr1
MAWVTQSYRVSFVTPAFLGNAAQQSQWRTPPFKALLRQWWRVANAAACEYKVGKLAEREGELFGVASDDRSGSRRSQVQLRLSAWPEGAMTELPQARSGSGDRTHNRQFAPNLYLGYGVLSSGTAVAKNEEDEDRPAIEPGQAATLTLRFPEGSLEDTLQLIQWFGTVGGRSRNGWGSLHLKSPASTAEVHLPSQDMVGWLKDRRLLLDLDDCLEREWPHTFGKDKRGPLIWVGSEKPWHQVIADLAAVRMRCRTQFRFNNTDSIQDRHIVGYPVNNPKVRSWDEKKLRLPNQVRFKVLGNGSSCKALVYHLPCGLPEEMAGGELFRSREIRVWKRVHTVLDDPNSNLQRLP